MKYLILTVSLVALSACTGKTAMNTFADEPFIEAKVIDEPPPPVQIVEKVKPLPLPGQMKLRLMIPWHASMKPISLPPKSQ
jgi:hypothetical protein